MKRRTLLRLLLTAPLTPLMACTRPAQIYHETIAVFGTLVRVSLFAQQPQQASAAFAAINARFQQIHTDWHAWEKGGLVSRINDAIAQSQPITLNAEVAGFIRRNQQLTRLSDGLFDPGIGRLIRLWGFHQNSYEGNRSPDPQAVTELLAQRPSILDIDWQGDTLYSTNPAVSLDFGASGKAYALNAAADTLRQQGIVQATVAIGGDIQVLGHKPDGPWRIGITDPLHPGQTLANLPLRDGEAACSSGTYERFYTDQGKKVSHILDPRTGQPVTHILHSTAVHDDSLIAEVGALSQLIAGPDHWHRLAAQLGIEHSYLLTPNGQPLISPALQQRLN